MKQIQKINISLFVMIGFVLITLISCEQDQNILQNNINLISYANINITFPLTW
jgi:hypothetical protein